jgi:hypothetical protein
MKQADNAPVKREPCRACDDTGYVTVALRNDASHADNVLIQTCTACLPGPQAGPGVSGAAGQVTVRTVEYVVTTWPSGHDCRQADLWCLVVAERGNGRWAVEQTRDHGFPKVVLARSGRWVMDRRGDPRLRFSLAEAMDAARRLAATVSIDGRATAEQAMRAHMATACPGQAAAPARRKETGPDVTSDSDTWTRAEQVRRQ